MKTATDSNTNDIVEMTITVNGRQYWRLSDMLNTQEDCAKLKQQLTNAIASLDLNEMSRFGS